MAQFDVAVVGAGLGAFHVAEEIAKKNKKISVAWVYGYTFQEWAMAAAIYLNRPHEHEKWTCGVPEKWQQKWQNVTYFLSSPESINCDQKTIKLMNQGPDAGKEITYKSLVLATGQKSPLLTPRPGMSLSERVAEVKQCGEALKNAKTVIFNGAGLVGVEMCGDFRVSHGYGARVILLSRSGKVLDSDFGDKSQKPDPKMVEKVTDVLTNKYKVEVKLGNVSDPNFSDAILTGGRVPLDGGETLDFDVFMPCFAAGPNTSFLVSSKSNLLDSRGALVTNDCLQSTAHPEVFGVGITTTKVPGHPVSSRITAQSKHCASEAVAVVEGKEPKTFKDKEAPPPLPHPMNVKIGHGPGGHMIWHGLPGPAKVCCCQCCNGGFPFCPPPCCWCCIPGCSGACGTCGKPAEGEGPAIFMPNLMGKMFTTNHGFKTLGDYGSEVPKQAKMT